MTSTNTRTLAALLGYAGPYKSLLLIGFVGMVVEAGCLAGFTRLVQPLVDKGLFSAGGSGLGSLPFLIVALVVLRAGASIVARFGVVAAARGVIKDLRQQLFDHGLKISAGYGTQTSGTVASLQAYNVERVSETFTSAISTLVKDALVILSMIGVMLYYSPMLTLLVLSLGPPIGFVIQRVGGRLRSVSRSIQTSTGAVAARAVEVLNAQKIVRIFAGEASESARFASENDLNRRQHVRLAVIQSCASGLVQIMAALGVGFIAWLYLRSISDGGQAMSSGALASFLLAMLVIMPSLRRLSNLQSVIQAGVAAVETIFDVLDMPVESSGSNDEPITQIHSIEFCDVSVSYPSRAEPVLRNINLSVVGGQTIAIVGRSGAGKSTLVDLLPRYVLPSSGRVMINDVDTRQISLSRLRSHIALVSQDTLLFNDTVHRNIAYGELTERTRDEVREAARRAHALDFIDALPGGFDSMIGEHGSLLSGGQRQRLAIARALLKDASILILDEATSSLDSESARSIELALNELTNNRTTFVIAHRLSTLNAADQIIVIDAGRVVESGTHDALLAEAGLYASLYRTQASAKAADGPAIITLPGA